MIGTIVNTASILAGSAIGIYLHKRIPKGINELVMQCLGLSVIVIGLQLALGTGNPLIMIFSLVLGSIAGELIGIDRKLDGLGARLKGIVRSKDDTFIDGFVTSSLIFCVGAMAVVGSIEDGASGNPSVLLTKSLLDGTASVAFAGAMGLGVAFSAIPVFLYQGAMTLASAYASNYLTASAIAEMSAVGGILIMAIGLGVLEIKKIKISNMLPSLAFALALSMIFA